MAQADDSQKKKGTFTRLRFSVAKKYVHPTSRAKIMAYGGGGALAVLAYFLLDAFVWHDRFISSGPLSAHHASFEKDCSACHEPRAVTREKCSGCHDQTGRKPGLYSFAAHYMYRSGDPRRSRASKQRFAANETPCYACHPEHLGRTSQITNVPDARCLECHKGFSFAPAHPEFAFARAQAPDAANLEFSHIDHVEYIGVTNSEKACGSCHNFQPDGSGFKPIRFDAHCHDCHLVKKTEPLHKDLTALARTGNPCRLCHVIENAKILPVQEDQRLLHRAEFHHSAHVLLRGCLDCHIEIPMPQPESGSSKPGVLKSDRSKDVAATQNIPKIGHCRQCHTAAAALDRCVMCHVFHPDKGERFSAR